MSSSSCSVVARRTPASRNSASTTASEPARAAVWRSRCAGAGAARAAAHGEDRLRAGDPASDTRELARVSERFEIEQDDVRLGIVLPVLQEVVRRDVGFVADRHERRKAQTTCIRLFQKRQPERAALRRERRPARWEGAARERRIEATSRQRRHRGNSGRSAGRRTCGRGRAAVPVARDPPSPSRRSRPR